MKRQTQSGFTLIELMVVVSIIGVLAAVAITHYKGYLVRSQVAAGLAEINPGKAGFELVLLSNNPNTTNVRDISLAPSTGRCSAIEMQPGQNGFIRCKLIGNPLIDGKYITLQHYDNGTWTCEAPAIDNEYKPPYCQ